MLSKWYIKKKVAQYDCKMEELFGDCEEHSVESFDGTRIAYRTIGEGEPAIVHCPGVFTSYMFFHYMKNYFSPNHKLVFWDYRGHPESDVPDNLESITLENCARDLKAVMDDAGVGKAVYTGHSMGVMTILEFYRQFPGKVLGLIPINGPYREGFEFAAETKKGQERVTTALRFLSHKPWLMEWFRPVVVLPINVAIAKKVEINPTMCPSQEMTLYFDYVAKMDWHAGFQALAAMSVYDGSDILETVKVPTLVICGDSDTWAPKKIADELHRHIKGSELAVIPGGSHATPAENPQMINYRIDLFLKNHFSDLMEGKHAKLPKKKAASRAGRTGAASAKRAGSGAR